MTLTAGSGAGSGPDDIMETACITVGTARDVLSENAETLFIVTEIVSNADLAEFQSSNSTTVTIQDGTGVFLCDCFLCLCMHVFPIFFTSKRKN